MLLRTTDAVGWLLWTCNARRLSLETRTIWDSHGMGISGDSNSNIRRFGRTENAFCTFGMDSETRLRFC